MARVVYVGLLLLGGTLLVLGVLVLCALGGCTSTALPPALPDQEVLFEGVTLADVTPYPFPDPGNGAELSRSLLVPLTPRWRPVPQGQRPASPPPWQPAALAPSPTEDDLPAPRRGRARPLDLGSMLQGVLSDSTARRTRATYRQGVIATYPYEPGMVYPLSTSPGAPSLITLPDGERLAHDPAFDDHHWEMLVMQTGTEEAHTYRQGIMVRAHEAGQRMRLTLRTTTGHTYFVLITATDALSEPELTWVLPDAPEALATARVQPVSHTASRGVEPAPAPPALEPKVGVTRIHTGWTIEALKAPPAWMPFTCWDDGSKIVIGFKSSLSFTTAPSVQVIGTNGKPTVVESIPYDNGDPRAPSYYIVSGLYPRVILKDADGATVRLTRRTGQPAPYQETRRDAATRY
jgi:type IV secretory pathway VirB9-like protein